MYFKEMQSRLWSEHIDEVQKFTKSPSLLPEYQKEWLKFVHKRTNMINTLGGNPTTYDYKSEFNITWPKMFDSIMNEKWQQKDKLCRKFSLNCQEPPDMSSIINKIYEEVNRESLSVQSFSLPSSLGSNIHNSLSSVLCEENGGKHSRSKSSDRKVINYSESKTSVHVCINLSSTSTSRSRSSSFSRKSKNKNYKRSKSNSFSKSRSRSISKIKKYRPKSRRKKRSNSKSFSRSRSRSISNSKKYKKRFKSDSYSRSRSSSISKNRKSKSINKSFKSKSSHSRSISRSRNKKRSKPKHISKSQSRSNSISKSVNSKKRSKKIFHFSSDKSERKIKYLKKDKHRYNTYSSRSRSRSRSINSYCKHKKSRSSRSTSISSRPSSRSSSSRRILLNSHSDSRTSILSIMGECSEQSQSPISYTRNHKTEFRHSNSYKKYKNCSKSRSKSKTPSHLLSKYSQSCFSTYHQSKSELPNSKRDKKELVDNQALQCANMKMSYSSGNKSLGNSVNLVQNFVIADRSKIVPDLTSLHANTETNQCPNTCLVERHSKVLDAMDEFLKEQASIKLNEVNNPCDFNKYLKAISLNDNLALETVREKEKNVPTSTNSPIMDTTQNLNLCRKERFKSVINAVTEQNPSYSTSKVENHSLLLDEMKSFFEVQDSMQLNKVSDRNHEHNSPNDLPPEKMVNKEKELVEINSSINTQYKSLCENEIVQKLINTKNNFKEFLKNANIPSEDFKKFNVTLDVKESCGPKFNESFLIDFKETLLYLKNNEDLLGVYPSVVNALLLELLTTDTNSLSGLSLDQNIALSLILDKLRLDLCKKSIDAKMHHKIQEAISKINDIISNYTLLNENDLDNCPIFYYGHDVVDIAERTLNKSAEETNKFIDIVLLHDGFSLSTSEPFENLHKMVANIKKKFNTVPYRPI